MTITSLYQLRKTCEHCILKPYYRTRKKAGRSEMLCFDHSQDIYLLDHIGNEDIRQQLGIETSMLKSKDTERFDYSIWNKKKDCEETSSRLRKCWRDQPHPGSEGVNRPKSWSFWWSWWAVSEVCDSPSRQLSSLEKGLPWLRSRFRTSEPAEWNMRWGESQDPTPLPGVLLFSKYKSNSIPIFSLSVVSSITKLHSIQYFL